MKLQPPRPREHVFASDKADAVLPEGFQLLALTWFSRRNGIASGRPYLWCSFRVIAGEHAGSEFQCAVAVDLSQVGTRRRWEVWAEAIGLVDEVELDNDEAITRSFLMKAFKAQIVVETLVSGRVVNDIGRLAYARQYTLDEQRLVAAWNKLNAR